MLQNPGQALRELLAKPEIIMAPGIFDGISARVAEQAGFPAGYISGAGVAASYLGEPDIGLTNGSDVADVARRIAVKANIPIISDADTGYGNALNAIRTVWDLERAGVAAVQLEDQVAPKRCGHLSGKQCISAGEFAAKIKAAKNEKMYKDTVIVARTDARAVYHLDEALRRGEMYLSAGADVLFIEAPQTLEEIRKITEAFKGVPLLMNQVIGGKTPRLTAKEAGEMGYKIIIYPDVMCYCASVMYRRACERIMESGQSWDAIPDAHDSRDLFGTMGMQQWRDTEALYSTREPAEEKQF
ncbi:2,3-dimethylmalate lyase [bioreactor metagenome]|uniref:2,3-dimethylmalate lyase n=1 Tax=bioreactor metagenome TaxID=1076179 RepID=A0A644XUI6_9ZZZZ